VPESVVLLLDHVSALEWVDPLNFPARVGEIESFLDLLYVDSFLKPTFQNFGVLVTDIFCINFTKFFVIFHFLLFLESHFLFVLSTFWSFNCLAPFHSSDLSQKEIWVRWKNLVDLHGCSREVTVRFNMLQPHHVTRLQEFLLLLTRIEIHE